MNKMNQKNSALAIAIALIVIGLCFALSPTSRAKGPLQGKTPRPPDGAQTLPEEQHLIQSLDGRLLFQAYCATCHGVDATGNGPAAPALKTPPADLTLIRKRNGGTFPMLRVQKTISGENMPTPAHGNREMPIWGPIFGQIAWDQDLGNVRVYNLAKYIESLQQK